MARARARLAGSVARRSWRSRWFRVWAGCRRCGMSRTLGAALGRGRAGRSALAGPSRSISGGPSVPDQRTNRITTRATAMASAMMAIVRVLMLAPSGWGASVDPTPIRRSSSRPRATRGPRKCRRGTREGACRAGRRSAVVEMPAHLAVSPTGCGPRGPGIRSASRPGGDLSERETGAALATDSLGDFLPGPHALAVQDEHDGAVRGYERPSAGL
jgi:hypothetical protein